MREIAKTNLSLQRNGKFLCSSRDPIKEAKAWLQTYAHQLAKADTVVVIGCGAGFHLTELLNTYPKIVVEIIELEVALFEQWKKTDLRFQNQQQVGLVQFSTASVCKLILEFKPSWVDYEKEYQSIADSLLDTKLGDIKTICLNLTQDNQSAEAKIWRALREMIA